MFEISHKTAATLTLDRGAALDFASLPAVIGWCLSQAAIRVERIDLCFRGHSAEYHSDHGVIEIHARFREDGKWQIRVSCNTLVRGTRESGRQLCFQLARRVVARRAVETIYWQPTRQDLPPSCFVWHALADLPQRFAAPAATLVSLPQRTAHA